MSLTTVVNIRGLSPEIWLANPTHVYVGRRIQLRSGKYAGQLWQKSRWANPYTLPEKPTRQDREDVLAKFAACLEEDVLRKQLLPELIGKVLGCWCAEWDGISEPMPLCHACVLAKRVNQLPRRDRR